jgi:hypothetical protein
MAPKVATDFSFMAVFSTFMLYMVRYWFSWQVPQLAGSMLVLGRPLPLGLCVSSPPWHESQPTFLWLLVWWKPLTSSWHS